MSNILYPNTSHAVTVIVEAGFGSGPLVDSPTWTDITSSVRELSTFRGKSGELDDVQVGSMRLRLSSPNREFDPTNGPAYVTFPGSSGSYWSVPDIASFGGAVSLDVRVAVQLPDWTPAAAGVIAGQGVLGSTLCWQLSVTTSGQLSLTLSTTGAASTATTSAGVIAGVDGQLVCVRATWSVSGDTVLYTKRTTGLRARADCESETGWVQIGSGTNVTAGLFNSSAVVSVGARSDGTAPLASGARVLFMVVDADGVDRLILDPVSAGSHPTTPPTSWVSELGGTWSRTGTASVVLAGPYWRSLVPGVPIRFRATYSAVTYDVWRGVVLRWPVEYISMGQDTVVEVDAVDLLGVLEELPVPETPFGIEIERQGKVLAHPEQRVGAYWGLHEPFPRTEFADKYGTVGGSFRGPVGAGGASQPASDAPTRQMEGAFSSAVQVPYPTLPAQPLLNYSLELGFWVYTATPSSWQVISGGGLTWVNDPAGVSYVQYDGGGGTIIDPVPIGAHYCAMSTASGAEVFATLDGHPFDGVLGGFIADFTEHPNLMISGAAGVTISDVHLGIALTPFDGYLAGATGRAGDTPGERSEWLLEAAGVPTGRTVITTDPSTFLGPVSGGGTFLQQLRAVNTAEQGRLYIDGAGRVTVRSRIWRLTAAASITSQTTFGDSAGEVLYDDLTIDAGTRDTLTNLAQIGSTNGATGEAINRDSVDTYGIRSYSAGGTPLQDAGDAANCAAWIILDRAYPRTRVRRLKLTSLGNAATAYPAMLGREIGDRVTVNRRPINPQTKATTGPTISEQVTIEGVAHVVTADQWVTEFHTAPATVTAAQGPYFTADDAVLSVVDTGVLVAY